jgi:hypothetical protein
MNMTTFTRFHQNYTLGCLLAAQLCGDFQTIFLLSVHSSLKNLVQGVGSTWGHNFHMHMGMRNGSKLEISGREILIHTLELKLPNFACLYRKPACTIIMHPAQLCGGFGTIISA